MQSHRTDLLIGGEEYLVSGRHLKIFLKRCNPGRQRFYTSVLHFLTGTTAYQKAHQNGETLAPGIATDITSPRLHHGVYFCIQFIHKNNSRNMLSYLFKCFDFSRKSKHIFKSRQRPF